MNIVLATDNNFVQHCCVAMASVLRHNSGVVFYIFTEALSDENMKLMTDLVTTLHGDINFCFVNSSIVKNFPMPTNADAHISIATYYRLLVDCLLPHSLERAIYMDCDMIVRGSLGPLWNEEIENYAIGAVFQPLSETQENDKERLRIPVNYGYFNAGLLLINLEYWRSNNVTGRLLSFIKENFASIKQHDQDVLNAVLFNEVKPISYIWNYLPLFFHRTKLKFRDYVDYSIDKGDPIVIHFVSAPKPWDYGCSHPYKSEYFQYLKDTPFRDYKPHFIWRKYYQNILRIKLINLIVHLDIFNIRKTFKARNR